MFRRSGKSWRSLYYIKTSSSGRISGLWWSCLPFLVYERLWYCGIGSQVEAEAISASSTYCSPAVSSPDWPLSNTIFVTVGDETVRMRHFDRSVRELLSSGFDLLRVLSIDSNMVSHQLLMVSCWGDFFWHVCCQVSHVTVCRYLRGFLVAGVLPSTFLLQVCCQVHSCGRCVAKYYIYLELQVGA